MRVAGLREVFACLSYSVMSGKCLYAQLRGRLDSQKTFDGEIIRVVASGLLKNAVLPVKFLNCFGLQHFPYCEMIQ